jgi:uncharacterized membrane protein
MIPGFTVIDGLAVAVFLASWVIYHFLIESRAVGRTSLNTRMNAYRRGWMQEMLRRDNRMVDVQVMAALHQGSAFFASTSLIAIGGALSLVRGAGDLSAVMASLPFGATASPAVWEMKIVGLAIIFIYAFFKFAWAYRLFNYAAILLGATPAAEHIDAAAERRALRCAEMTVVAGRHFNRGQRAFFFALAYLGWLLGPWVFIASTIAALIVIARRQFGSDALEAILIGDADDAAAKDTARDAVL